MSAPVPTLPGAAAVPDPTVLALHVAPERHLPMVGVAEVVAEAGLGLVGDRYHGSRHRHVSVQSATELAEAAKTLGFPVEASRTRRNVTLSHGTVPVVPGERFTIGAVTLEVVRVAAPCRVMEESVGPGARAALRRRGGAICRVLAGGTLRIGDVGVLPGPPT